MEQNGERHVMGVGEMVNPSTPKTKASFSEIIQGIIVYGSTNVRLSKFSLLLSVKGKVVQGNVSHCKLVTDLCVQ